MSFLQDRGSAAVAVRGAQRPRVLAVPSYESDATADKALRFLDLIGFTLDPWQEFVLAESLGQQSDGSWGAFEVALVVPRQNGKSELLAARQLVGLFVLHENLIIHTAQQFDTAKEVFRRVEDVIENEPMLKRRVDLNRGRVGRWANGQEGIELLDQCRLRYRARGNGGGGRGFTGDCLMFDEAMILAEATVGSVLPLLSSVPFPQVWYAGSAVDRQIHEHGIVLSRVRDRGMSGTDPSLAYFEWSAPGDDPDQLDDDDFANREYRATANPAFELRIADSYITHEQRALSRRSFAVERFGVGDWYDTSEDAERLVPRAVFDRCGERDASNRIASGETFAIDTNLDQSWASIGVAGFRGDGLRQVALARYGAGPDWIVAACEELRSEHPDARFVVDKLGPAANLIKALRRAGLPVVETDPRAYIPACTDLLQAFLDESLRYPWPQPELEDALVAAKKQDTGDRWKWSRKQASGSDISPLVAVTLALWGAESGIAAPKDTWRMV